MRRISTYILVVLLLLLTTGCSRKGVHMSKHRKQRHCDCPTFSDNFYGESYYQI